MTSRATLLVTLFYGVHLQAQVINAPDLACASTLVNGDVLLTWNLPSNICGPFVSYDIFGSSTGASGPYNLLTSVTNQTATTFLHSGANGTSTTWHYYMMSNYNCPGYTALSSDTVDNLDPVSPSIINATVVGNSVELNWMPFASPETRAFIIYRNIGGFNPIDTVFGRGSTQYVDQTAQPHVQPEEYIIAAMDSCGNTGTTTPVSHKTIHLDYAVASCAGFIDLNWTAYEGFAVTGYDVVYNVNGGSFQVASSLSPNDNNYQLTGFVNNDSVCIYVEARGSAVAARSNMACIKVGLTQALEQLSLTGLTVLPDQTVQVSWAASKADITKITVQRSKEGDDFSNVKSFSPPYPAPLVMSYVDGAADPAERPWFYRILASDSCGQELVTPAVKTVNLRGKARPNFTNTLEWNDPDFSGGTVNIYALNLQAGMWALRDQTNLTSYTDNVGDLIGGNGEFCYYVEAHGVMSVSGASMSFVSTSNTLCLKQYAVIIAPTAFVPDGVNNEFKPVITFGRDGTYRLSVYNRYGQMLFHTGDPNEGWDGRHDGTPAPQGVYAYVIEVQGPNNNNEVRTGTVMLIR